MQTEITAGNKKTGILEKELSELRLQLDAKEDELTTLTQLHGRTHAQKFEAESALETVRSEMETLRSQTMNTSNQFGNVDPNTSILYACPNYTNRRGR